MFELFLVAATLLLRASFATADQPLVCFPLPPDKNASDFNFTQTPIPSLGPGSPGGGEPGVDSFPDLVPLSVNCSEADAAFASFQIVLPCSSHPCVQASFEETARRAAANATLTVLPEFLPDVVLEITSFFSFGGKDNATKFSLTVQVDVLPKPTDSPTVSPTSNPTTSNPTANPTANPTTSNPTSNPTANPTTSNPTSNPTANPTTANPTTNNPTSNPTANPTTSNPTSNPTPQIGVTQGPSVLTLAPTPLILVPTPPMSPPTPLKTPQPTNGPSSPPPPTSPPVQSTAPSPAPSASPPTSQPSQAPSFEDNNQFNTATPTYSPTSPKPTPVPTSAPEASYIGLDFAALFSQISSEVRRELNCVRNSFFCPAAHLPFAPSEPPTLPKPCMSLVAPASVFFLSPYPPSLGSLPHRRGVRHCSAGAANCLRHSLWRHLRDSAAGCLPHEPRSGQERYLRVLLGSYFLYATAFGDPLNFELCGGLKQTTLQVLFVVSTAFVGVPLLVNLFNNWRLVRSLKQSNAKFAQWCSRHWCTLSAVFVLASTSANVLTTIASGLFGFNNLSAPLTPVERARIKIHGLWSVFLEDCPQLAVQLILIKELGQFGSQLPDSVLASLVVTSCSILFGFFSKMYLMCQLKNKQSRLWTKHRLAANSKHSSRNRGQKSMHTGVELESFGDSDQDETESEDDEGGGQAVVGLQKMDSNLLLGDE